MPRATTKTDLIEMANVNYEKLWETINSMSQEKQLALFNFNLEKVGKQAHWQRDKNIKDVLTHLYEWHQLLLNFVTSNLNGEEKPFLLAPYNWKTYGQMNVYFYNKHQNTSYVDSKDMLIKSHNDVMSLINTFNNDELFAKGQFKWTKTSTLGSYCVSATASHYDWATTKIKKHQKL